MLRHIMQKHSASRLRSGLVALSAVTSLCALPALAAEPHYGAAPPDLARQLERLVASYPDVIKGVEGNDLVLHSGKRLVISDGRADKSFDQLLNAPDIDDMFAFTYDAHAEAAAPPLNNDPGRIRVEALFREIYGDCGKGGVKNDLVKIDWVPKFGGGTVTLSNRMGAAEALKAVSADLEKLPAGFAKYLRPSAGTFNCRTIANTNRRSMHAFGVAIDINTDFTTYWEWSKKKGSVKWSNRIPKEIVDIFENHGFIWGGRWYHYDTMHFEYRPELLMK